MFLLTNNKTKCILKLGAIFIAGTSFSLLAQEVSINNSGFESGYDDWRVTEDVAISGDENSGSQALKLQDSTGQVRQYINVDTNSSYVLNAYVKGSAEIGVNVDGSVTSSSVSFNDYTQVSVEFDSNDSDTIDVFAKWNGAEGRVDDFTLEKLSGDTPVSSDAVLVPAKIEAEDYTGFYDTTDGNVKNVYRFDDVDINTTSDVGGGYFVGWSVPTEYLEYDIQVDTSSDYVATIRMATIRTNARFTVSINGSLIADEQTVTNTQNWDTYYDHVVDLGYLSTGSYTLTITNTNSNYNINWLDIAEDGEVVIEPPTSEAVNIPAKIEAEDFSDYSDSSLGNVGGGYNLVDDVDIKETDDIGGGYQVGWFTVGEWLEYDINVSNAGNYTANVRASASGSNKSFTVDVDGSQVADVSVIQTGSYASFEDNFVDLGYLSAGTHTIRFTSTNQYFDINYIDIQESTIEPPVTGDCNIDMTIWGYTISDGDSKNATSDIQDLVDNVTIGDDEITWDNGCVTFKAKVYGETTSDQTKFVRSELRELVSEYDFPEYNVKSIQNNWITSRYDESDKDDARAVDGKMTATLSISAVTVDASSDYTDQVGRIVVGQIHGIDNEPVKIYYQKMPEHTRGSVWFTTDGSGGSTLDRVYIVGYSDKDYEKHVEGETDLADPTDGIALGEEWSYEIELMGNQLKVTVWHDGKVYTTADSIAYSRTQSRANISNDDDTDAITLGTHFDNDWMYFKAGVYNQNATATQAPLYSEATFTQIDVEHY